MNICLFSKEEINCPLNIKDERAQHLIKVLHKKEGDTFTAGIIDGEEGIAAIEAITGTDIKYSFKPTGEGKLLKPLKMIIGFPRPIQLKRLLRDVAGLGVCEVHLTATELGDKSYLQSNLLERGSAYKMLLDGTVQAGGTHVPALFMHDSLDQAVKAAGEGVKLALDNVGPKMLLGEALKKAEGTVIAAIGSERGWTNNERELLENSGYIRCGMGERILRTETAATVAGAIILDRMGYLYG